MPVLFVLGVVVDRARGADAGHDIFTLGVHQPFTVELVVAGGRVAGEGYAGGGRVAHVSKHHGLDVDSGAPVVRDAFDPAIGDGLFAVPALEHGRDTAPELCQRVVREGFAEVFFNQRLECLGERLEVVGAKIRIGLAAFRVLDLVKFFIEDFADAFSQGGFQAFRLLHHHVGVHHDQASVGIPDETGVVRLFDHAGDGDGGQADVENGVHHAGHGGAGAGAAGDEQRINGVAVFHAHDRFGLFQRGQDLVGQFVRELAASGVISGAAFGADGEARRNGDVQGTHFREIGAFAAQQILVACSALGGTAAEGKHIFSHGSYPFLFCCLFRPFQIQKPAPRGNRRRPDFNTRDAANALEDTAAV